MNETRIIKPGDEVEDTLSGFRGVVIARHEYLNGCARLTVQPRVVDPGRDMKLPESQTFDEVQLAVVKSDPKTVATGLGGPERYMPRSRPTGSR